MDNFTAHCPDNGLLVEFPTDFKPVPSHEGVVRRISAEPKYLPPGGFWKPGTKNITPGVDKPKPDVVQ
jgi:hypothetical protein